MKTALTVSVALLAGSVLALSSYPTLHSPKVQDTQPIRRYGPAASPKPNPHATAPREAPAALPLYFLHNENTGPVAIAVDTDDRMVLVFPTSAPALYVPNASQATFAMFQSSPTVLGPWSTVGYFTNFVNGFNLVDVTATNQSMYFYRLVPQ